MDTLINTVVSIVLLSCLYKYFENGTYDVTMVKSEVNQKEYLVRNQSDKQESANLISKIAIRLDKLNKYLQATDVDTIYQKYYKSDVLKELGITDESNEENKSIIKQKEEEVKTEIKNNIARAKNNFNPDNFSESTPDAKYTSYSVNKGEKIVMCIRNKKDGNKLVKLNILMFVALHEFAHVFTKSVGHTEEFWENFKYLLKVAIDIGIYKKIDFTKYPKNYCGTKITDSPY